MYSVKNANLFFRIDANTQFVEKYRKLFVVYLSATLLLMCSIVKEDYDIMNIHK